MTVALLRRRAEHNGGELGTLEEVSLHGCDLEDVSSLGHLCRHLKILYLQNNVLSRLGAQRRHRQPPPGLVVQRRPPHSIHTDGLHRLKSLQYLNLALNNLTEACAHARGARFLAPP